MLKNITRVKYLFLFAIVIFVYLIILIHSSDAYLQNNHFPYGVRLLTDNYDRLVHFDRAQWYIQNKIPYKEIFSEYPQFITYLFAVPALFTTQSIHYINLYSFFMAIFYLLLVWITLELLKIYDKPYHYILLLLLPSFLYHTLNRFDILPSLLVSLALLLYLKNRYWLSLTSLVSGFFIKWYPILIVPLFLSQIKIKEKKTYYQYIAFVTLFILVVFSFSFIWSGTAMFQPYFWHAHKGYYFESIYYLIILFENILKIDFIPIGMFALVFQLLSIFYPMILFFEKSYFSKEKLLKIILFIILIFIFFSSGRAPQFNLWFVPLFILGIRDKWGIYLLIIFDIVNYLFYPIGFATAPGQYHYINDILSITKNLLYIALFYYLLQESFLKHDNSNSASNRRISESEIAHS